MTTIDQTAGLANSLYNVLIEVDYTSAYSELTVSSPEMGGPILIMDRCEENARKHETGRR